MKITDGVYALESTRGNYAYAILGPAVILIDTGRPGQGKHILAELRTLNVQPKDIRHIFLTHHDGDHIGNAAFLQRETGAQIWASQTDRCYILGEEKRSGIKWLASMLLRPETPDLVNAYPPENELQGIKIIPTPGHTPGHVCLLYKDVLFTGDLVVSYGGKVNPSPAIMTWDMKRVKESIRNVAALPFRWVCPAHGTPVERGEQWELLMD